MPRPRALLLPLAAAAALLTPAAPAPAVTLVTQWDVSYDVTITYDHHLAVANTARDVTLAYSVSGKLPEADFRDGAMMRGISGDVRTTVDGKMSAETRHADGESSSCGGGPGQLNGFVTVAGATHNLLVAPFIGVNATCSGGEDAVGVAPPAGSPSSMGVKVKLPSKAELSSKQWERPFTLEAKDDKCPGVNPAETIGCTATWKGTVRFALRKSSEEKDDDDLLGPTLDDLLGPKDKPKLNPKKDEARVRIKCPKACTVEPDIGIFTKTKDGRPYVKPVWPGRKQRLKANRATTVKAPLNSKAQLVADQGMAGMRLTVTMAGKRYTESFALR